MTEAGMKSTLCSPRALGTRGKLEYSPWAVLATQLPAVSPTISMQGTAVLQPCQGPCCTQAGSAAMIDKRVGGITRANNARMSYSSRRTSAPAQYIPEVHPTPHRGIFID